MVQNIVPVAGGRLLTADAYQRLADVPPEVEWFANLGNAATRRAYENALQDFMKFTGIVQAAYFSPSWTPFQADGGRDFSVIVDGVSI
jgi:hypothetical protein